MKFFFRAVFLLIFLIPLKLFSQDFQVNWTKKPGEGTMDFLQFKGASYPDGSGLPYIVLSEPSSGAYKYALEGTEYSNLTREELSIFQKSAVPSYPEFESAIGSARGRKTLTTVIFPFRKDPISGEIQKLTRYRLKKSYITERAGPYNREYANTSILAAGTWYKIGVTSAGIQKIDATWLVNAGIPLNSFDPRNIRIYGNGGGMLPENNAITRPDDLKECAIQVGGENDGSFDGGDYILFYGQAPDIWKLQDSVANRPTVYVHQNNVYTDTNYYYLTFNLGPGKRIVTEDNQSLVPNYTSNGFDYFDFYDQDLINLKLTGREFFGEKFDIVTSYNFSFNIPNLQTSGKEYLRVSLAARSITSASFFTVVAGSTTYKPKLSVVGTGETAAYASMKDTVIPINANADALGITLSYAKPSPSDIGWLNFLEVNARRNPVMIPGQMTFRDRFSVASGRITQFSISNFTYGSSIWNITDHNNITTINYAHSGSTATFNKATGLGLNEFIAFDGSAFHSPAFKGRVDNQNLHGLSQADFIIIVYDKFKEEAERLAAHHRSRDNLKVHVVTIQQVFNEYASGKQDPTSIKDFMIQFYYRDPSTAPKYLCLFGDGSYDYKAIVSENSNRIPVYESQESLLPLDSYTSDDYFGYIDPEEGVWGISEKMDIGVGRLPVNTLNEAKIAVDKILAYNDVKTTSIENCNQVAEVQAKDWKNTICFIADDQDKNLHLNQAEDLARIVEDSIPIYNVDKIYLDAYRQEFSAAGSTYPEVNKAINKRFETGALVVNYTGHGGETGLAEERIITIPQIQSWNNIQNMPLFITATCEFSRYDEPARKSAGEYIFLNKNGGAIALFSTVRVVSSAPNFDLNRVIYNHIVAEENEPAPRLGDIFRQTKVDVGSSKNHRNFTLLGDPALTLQYSEFRAAITSINNNTDPGSADTLKALSNVTIKGEIRTQAGVKIDNYNGIIYPVVFDKQMKYKTLANDTGGDRRSYARDFYLQKNVLFRGKAKVVNGDFSFTFVVPKDIIPADSGKGRISLYAENESSKAAGAFENFQVNGVSANAAIDNIGPEVDLYMNDKKFVYGGITGEDPKLLAYLKDQSGINTTGTGVGHDITVMLDNNTQEVSVLNDFYESDLDNYQSGSLVFPFTGLSEGKHNLRFKAWDIHNNPSEASLEFIVAKSAEIALTHVLNYPNPFTTSTTFMFEHNQSCQQLDVEIRIFTISGKLVKTIETGVTSDGFRVDNIKWDGRDDFGDKIGKGVYVYKIKVKTSLGFYADKIEKLVILN